MQRLELEVKEREGRGKGLARKLRARGAVPGIVYGVGLSPTQVEADAHQLERLLASSAHTLIGLKGHKGVKGRLVLIKELQRDPVSRTLVHCDFFAIDPEREIHVSVPVHFLGRAAGVELGGVLEPLMREIEVACLPLVIPDGLDVEVTSLEVGGSVRVADLTLPEGIRAIADADAVVVHVVAPRLEVEEAPAEAEEEAIAGEEGEKSPEAEGEATDSGDAGA
ncbi:MAG: 50S ribosomal protein L25 [Myxococcota bacterium]